MWGGINMSRATRIVLMALLFVAFSVQAQAGLFRSGESVTIDRDQEMQENLTAVGESVHMYGIVHGDLISACDILSVDGYVDGQLLAVARTVNIHGGFGGDALIFAQEITVSNGGFEDFRGAGQKILIDVPILGDVLAAGQYVTLGTASSVAGDVVIAGQFLTVDSEVNGKLLAAGESIRIGAVMHGNAVVYTDDLTFSGNGRIEGNLTVHYTEHQPDIPDDAVIGKVDFVQEEQGSCGSCGWMKVLYILATIVTGLLLLLMFRRSENPDLEWAFSHPFPSLGFGFLTFAILPVAIIVGAVLVVTAPISIMLALVYGPLLYIGWIFGCWLAGEAVLRSLMKKVPSRYLSLPLGIVLISLIAMIPYAGGIIGFIVLLNGLGMLTKGIVRLVRG